MGKIKGFCFSNYRGILAFCLGWVCLGCGGFGVLGMGGECGSCLGFGGFV